MARRCRKCEAGREAVSRSKTAVGDWPKRLTVYSSQFAAKWEQPLSTAPGSLRSGCKLSTVNREPAFYGREPKASFSRLPHCQTFPHRILAILRFLGTPGACPGKPWGQPAIPCTQVRPGIQRSQEQTPANRLLTPDS